MPSRRVTFFTLCSEDYFPGLVGLLNSLRLTGHRDPVMVADCGLTEWQRALLLRADCGVFGLKQQGVSNPAQLKAFAHLLDPSGVIVMIDADMIVCRSMEPILAAAAEGRIGLYPDPERGRWFADWQEVFALPAPPRRQTYGCSGLLAFSREHWPDLLAQWWAACARILDRPTYQEGSADGPTAQADQDALNAILMSAYPPHAVAFLPEQEQVFRWDFPRLSVTDLATLQCRWRGGVPRLLHACLTPKPWQRAGVRRNAYLRLLRRLLAGPDLAISVPEGRLPVWLRPGAAGELAVAALSVSNMLNRDDGVVPKRAYEIARWLKQGLRTQAAHARPLT